MVSEIKSNTNDLLVVAGRLDNTARLEGTVDTAAWRKIMRDLAGDGQRKLIAIYKELVDGDETANTEPEGDITLTELLQELKPPEA